MLANAVQDYRRTEKIPLLNSHFNMFRIGLIKKIFPRAKFILIIKNHYEIIESCYDKWSEPIIKIEYPKIGLHWFTINSCCLYDLKKYASGDYCFMDFSELFNESEKTSNMLNDKLDSIGLNKFDYNLNIINRKYRFLGKKYSHELQYENFFGWIDSIISDEKEITQSQIVENQGLM
tara:strand:- start:115 stop:645 length:531 start_codon:yes stop_codon:yes gene_type:complete